MFRVEQVRVALLWGEVTVRRESLGAHTPLTAEDEKTVRRFIFDLRYGIEARDPAALQTARAISRLLSGGGAWRFHTETEPLAEGPSASTLPWQIQMKGLPVLSALCLSFLMWGCEACQRVASGMTDVGDAGAAAPAPSAPPLPSLDTRPTSRIDTYPERVFQGSDTLPEVHGAEGEPPVGAVRDLVGWRNAMFGRAPPATEVGRGAVRVGKRWAHRRKPTRSERGADVVRLRGRPARLGVVLGKDQESRSWKPAILPLGALGSAPGRRGENVSQDRRDLLLRLRSGVRPRGSAPRPRRGGSTRRRRRLDVRVDVSGRSLVLG